jgi:hypothetical protein
MHQFELFRAPIMERCQMLFFYLLKVSTLSPERGMSVLIYQRMEGLKKLEECARDFEGTGAHKVFQ